MRVGERVDDFVIRTRRAALRLNLGDEMLHYAIIYIGWWVQFVDMA
jgi:hypothetical protein